MLHHHSSVLHCQPPPVCPPLTSLFWGEEGRGEHWSTQYTKQGMPLLRCGASTLRRIRGAAAQKRMRVIAAVGGRRVGANPCPVSLAGHPAPQGAPLQRTTPRPPSPLPGAGRLHRQETGWGLESGQGFGRLVSVTGPFAAPRGARAPVPGAPRHRTSGLTPGRSGNAPAARTAGPTPRWGAWARRS